MPEIKGFFCQPTTTDFANQSSSLFRTAIELAPWTREYFCHFNLVALSARFDFCSVTIFAFILFISSCSPLIDLIQMIYCDSVVEDPPTAHTVSNVISMRCARACTQRSPLFCASPFAFQTLRATRLFAPVCAPRVLPCPPLVMHGCAVTVPHQSACECGATNRVSCAHLMRRARF